MGKSVLLLNSSLVTKEKINLKYFHQRIPQNPYSSTIIYLNGGNHSIQIEYPIKY